MARSPFSPESIDELRPIWAALVRALRAAKRDRNYEPRSLREPTVELAIIARRYEVPPETLLVLIKRAAYDQGLDGMSDYWRELLISRLVRWSIEAYYGVEIAEPKQEEARHDLQG
jgi:hypothetical protein